MPVGAPDEQAIRAQLADVAEEVHRLTNDNLTALRELRAEVQDLRTVLESVQRGEATVKSYANYIQRTNADIAEVIQRIRNDSDSIRHLHNILEQMGNNPLLTAPETDLDAQEQMHLLSMLIAQIQRIEFIVGMLTIPARLNIWLQNARPGYYIPFHVVFEDELPVYEDRVRLLTYLAFSPQAIRGGIVDAENGLIYRYAEKPADRRRSMILVVGGLIAATLFIIGICYLPVTGWLFQPRHLPNFLTGWAAVLVGIIVHTGIGGVKRRQTGGLPPVVAVNDLPLILDARMGQILLRLLWALVGLFGLAFAAGIGNVTPINSFLVGYSLDSIIEVFGASLDQQAQAQAATLKQQLGLSGK